jgi:hypothetical protein
MRPMDAQDIEIWLKIQELMVRCEWASMQRNRETEALTAAAQHMREAGHALRFGCCRTGGEQLALA